MKVKHSISIPIDSPENCNYLIFVWRNSALLEESHQVVKVYAPRLVLIDVDEKVLEAVVIPQS